MIKVFAVLATLLVLLTAAAMTGSWLVRTSALDDPDAIVVLASHEWERLPRACELAFGESGTRVWLTMPAAINQFTCWDCASRQAALVQWGLDRSRIEVVPGRVTNTWDEARAVREFIEAHHHQVKRLGVVTSAYHTRRAGATFRRVFTGTGVSVAVYDPGRWSEETPTRWWATREGRYYVAYELAAVLLKYPLFYDVTPWD